jgi:3-deoxy-D-manno-octulosonic-acid transferase
VNVDRHDPKVSELRRLLGIQESSLVWVVGSTQAPEEAWALEMYEKLKRQVPQLHLIIVPRHQERFEEVARLMSDSKLDYQRRSKLNGAFSGLSTQDSGLTLVDTLGELKAIWGLADVGFVGGSFNDRGGQNMIEPAAYGVAVTFGPKHLELQADRILTVATPGCYRSEEQGRMGDRHITSPSERSRTTGLGATGQQFCCQPAGGNGTDDVRDCTIYDCRAHAEPGSLAA